MTASTHSLRFALTAAICMIAFKPAPSAAIVGGYDAAPGQFPYMASLRRSSHSCGATIINSRQLLTAASCVSDATATELMIRVGTLQHSSGGTIIPVQQVRIHADYDSWTLANNIAILDIASPLDGVKPASLPSQLGAPHAGSTVTVIGWGPMKEGGSLPRTLQYADIPVVDINVCKVNYSGYNDITSTEFCDGVEAGGKSACGRGDEGGPVMQGDSVVGIISYSNGCARPGYPGVSVRVGSYTTWIQEQGSAL